MGGKVVHSNYRIMKILKLLMERPRSFEDLCFELDSDNHGVQKQTITKYFSILREFGCVIEKRNLKFALNTSPFQLSLRKSDVYNLALFYNYALSLCQDKKAQTLKNALFKILKNENLTNFLMYVEKTKSENVQKNYLKYEGKIHKICEFLDEKQAKIKILYKKSYYLVTPKHLKYSHDKVYLVAFDENNLVNRNFLLDNIKEILNLGQISTRESFIKPTVFELTGRVANGYTNLYEGEIVLKRENDLVVIENKLEDKDVLIHRLLKYGDFCKIISPSEDKEKYNKIVDEMLETLGK